MLGRLGNTVSRAATNGSGNQRKHHIPPARTRTLPTSRSGGYYAVKQGFKFKHNYLYTSWSDFQADVKGQRNGIYWPIVKKFYTRDAARAWLRGAIPAGPQVSPLLPDSLRWNGMTSDISSNYPVHLSSGVNLSAPLANNTPQENNEILEKLMQVRSRGFITTEDGALVVYTDGSCKGNRMPWARAGCGVWWGHYGTAYELRRSERLPGALQTSNRAELIGIIRALETCPFPDLPLEIRTDSRDCIDCIHSFLPKWLERGSLDLHEEFIVDHDLVIHLLTLLSYRNQANGVRFKHVKAHSGEMGNEWADYLASEGTRMMRVLDRKWLNITDLRQRYRCDTTEKREADHWLNKYYHHGLAWCLSAPEQVAPADPRAIEHSRLFSSQFPNPVQQARKTYPSDVTLPQTPSHRAATERRPLFSSLQLPNLVEAAQNLNANNITDRPLCSNTEAERQSFFFPQLSDSCRSIPDFCADIVTNRPGTFSMQSHGFVLSHGSHFVRQGQHYHANNFTPPRQSRNDFVTETNGFFFHNLHILSRTFIIPIRTIRQTGHRQPTARERYQNRLLRTCAIW